ncbi:aspartate aminotransferase family protein [Undibacter mobilis]|uniref:Aspartate aminotransferase family protein n=1 Tax=Undibacter mobilis TaxID=2292256 RepID=A0A371BAQ2_9BRAD|nr:aspartate aminotransferase family protein [Undibacter mobilis]RDV04686.1 aspartate aminotransferase family protein [Undibacter mobilis]
MTQKPLLNSFNPGNANELDAPTKALIARRQRALGAGYRLFYERPVYAERAEGIWLYGKDGERYLDAYNNVPSVGHCHPRVVEAIAKQAAKLNTHTRYLFDVVIDYAETLLATFPPDLDNVMFTCSGSEATDLALRVARDFTQAEGIIVTRHAYHGTTAAAAEVSPSRGATSPRIRTVGAPDFYRSPDGNVGAQLAEEVARAIDSLKKDGAGFAGLVLDTVFSSDGLCVEPAGFLRDVTDVVRAAGGLLIADEVQGGFGRTGSHMWGFARHGIVPDLVVMGKAMGNGMPIGGVVGKSHLFDKFGKSNRYFNTFAGNPVCCAAALAVLEVIESEQLMANSVAVGNYLRTALADLARPYPQIGDVRGAGLFAGVEFVKDQSTRQPNAAAALACVNALRDKRILISTMGPYGSTLKIRPPLPFTREAVDLLIKSLGECLTQI